MSKSENRVQRRKETFTERPATKIWLEQPHPENPFVAINSACYGYDLVELMQQRSFVDVFFLLFNGRLPSRSEKELLDALMCALINPGPRHPATRAAMNTGVGKTETTHILPISLGILSGTHLGAAEVETSMRFLRRNLKKDPGTVAHELLTEQPPDKGDWHPAPGFGSRFSAIDPLCQKVIRHLLTLDGAGKCLRWGDAFASVLNEQGRGWLSPGIAAATLADLGFHPRFGAGLFQLLCAPGLLAHGLEMVTKPITAMPFPDDDHYFIEDEHEQKT